MATNEPIPQGTVQTEQSDQQAEQADDALPVADYRQNPRYEALKEVVARANADRAAEAAEKFTVTDDAGNIVEEPKNENEAGEPNETAEDVEGTLPAASGPAGEGGRGEAGAGGTDGAPAAVAAAQAGAGPLASGIDPNAEYEFIVDGKPMKFKGAQVIDAGTRTLQKESAADHRLQAASLLLEEAKRTVGAVRTPEGANVTLQQPQQTNQQAQPMDDAALAELLQFGTKEQATEAIRVIRQQALASAPQVQQMQQQLQQLPAMMDAREQWRRAAEKAKSEYGDLLADPTLAAFFYHQEDARRQAGDKRSWDELYSDIGESMRKAFSRPKPSGAVATVQGKPANGATPNRTMEERRDAKRAAPAAPRLASARLESGGEQKPKSREEILEAMRRSRGQAGSLNRQ